MATASNKNTPTIFIVNGCCALENKLNAQQNAISEFRVRPHERLQGRFDVLDVFHHVLADNMQENRPALFSLHARQVGEKASVKLLSVRHLGRK